MNTVDDPDARRARTIDSWLVGCASAYVEGDIFHLLRGLSHTIRSFELAPLDGAIECGHGFEVDLEYATRLWKTIQESTANPDSHELLYFDVKCKFSRKHEDQSYFTSATQKRLAAFYICFRTIDSSFVEVIPNWYQNLSAEAEADPGLKQNSLVLTSRASRFPFRMTGPDLSSSPYRMPIHLLPKAISGLRACAVEDVDYVNPHTGVRFRNFRPQKGKNTDHLLPREESQGFS